jgi:hypothetical protein
MRIRRERARLSAADVSRGLGWPQSKTSRIEAGLYPVSDIEVSYYLGWCRVPADEVATLLELKDIDRRDPGFWTPLSTSMRSLVYHESTATRSTSYESSVVPGLLQTEPYVEALFRGGGFPERKFASGVKARLDRQQILDRPMPGEFIFYIHEQALRLTVGSLSTMHEQLLHLVLAAAREHIAIRVVPMSAGAASGAFEGSFRLFEFSKRDRPLLYLSSWVGGLFIDDASYISGYRGLVPKLADIALSLGQSRELLASLASEYDRAEGDLHADLEEKQL